MATPEFVKVEALRAFTDTTPEGQFHGDPNSHLEGGKFVMVPANRVDRLLELGWAKLAKPELRQLDHDGDGKAGGSLPHDPPALSGLKRAELFEVARNEGVAVNATRTNADIIAAIEAARAAASEEDVAP